MDVEQHQSERVAAEFLGLARAFRSRVATAAEASGSVMQKIGADAFSAFRLRKPGPRLHDELLAELEQRWRALPAPGGVSQTVVRHRHNISLADTRVRPEVVTNAGWSDGGTEPSVCLVTSTLVVNRLRAHTTSQTLASFSLHAIARFYQRSFEDTDDALFADIAMIAAAAPTMISIPGRFELPSRYGEAWVGTVAPFRDVHGRSAPVVNIRSFY